MIYESLIGDMELIQGDSSPIWFIGTPDNRQLDDGNWNAAYKIMTDYGQTPLVERSLSVNSGIGEGDTYTAGTKFIFQILPAESSQLAANTKYAVVVELWNNSINYRGEIARFKTKILQGS